MKNTLTSPTFSAPLNPSNPNAPIPSEVEESHLGSTIVPAPLQTLHLSHKRRFGRRRLSWPTPTRGLTLGRPWKDVLQAGSIR